MFDIWIGDIEITGVVLIVSVVLLLPVQLLLCFKVKNKAIRWLPAIELSVATLVFAVLYLTSTGWDKIGYMLLAVFAGFMLLMCGVGWVIWWSFLLVKKIRGFNYKNALVCEKENEFL